MSDSRIEVLLKLSHAAMAVKQACDAITNSDEIEIRSRRMAELFARKSGESLARAAKYVGLEAQEQMYLA